MALFHRQYVLASTPMFHPLGQPNMVPPAPIGIHVSYVEYYRKAIKPGEIEPRFLLAPSLSYQDGSLNVVAVPNVEALPDGLGRIATIEIQKTIDTGATFFSLLLPNVVPRVGAVEAITTVGLTSRVAGPDNLPRPIQSPVYSAVELHGTYSEADGGEPPAAAPAQAAAKRNKGK
jgi:hypothetical protein